MSTRQKIDAMLQTILIIPVGLPFMSQDLLVLEKDEKGMFSTRNVLPVSFVPLTRK